MHDCLAGWLLLILLPLHFQHFEWSESFGVYNSMAFGSLVCRLFKHCCSISQKTTSRQLPSAEQFLLLAFADCKFFSFALIHSLFRFWTKISRSRQYITNWFKLPSPINISPFPHKDFLHWNCLAQINFSFFAPRALKLCFQTTDLEQGYHLCRKSAHWIRSWIYSLGSASLFTIKQSSWPLCDPVVLTGTCKSKLKPNGSSNSPTSNCKLVTT